MRIFSILKMSQRSKSPPVKLEKLRSEAGFRAKKQHKSDKAMDDNQVDYIIQGPLRKIEPYYFTYLTYCKLRWRDRTLFDIFSNEFRDRDSEYYAQAIKNGEVKLNDKIADIDTLVRNGDLISHTIHRHEPPVTSRPIRIVKETDELIVVDKPAGIPVHPTGRYRYNTVTKVLQLEQGIEAHPCNRLDRLTSGLMFLAKNPKGADNFVEQLRKRDVSKEYIARVKGKFPLGEVIVEKPLITLEPRLGLNKIDEENGKEAKTIFKRLSFDGETSIVKCKPLTGRTHQIRVHLQYLGFPIANDPIYSNTSVWGESLGINNEANYDDVMAELDKVGKTKSASSWINPTSKGEVLLDSKCEVCSTDLYSDPGPNDLDLWLHAYKYSYNGSDDDVDPWSYQTPFPDWALDCHRSNMELALKQAQKCEETTTAFGVGAVLALDGEVLETGYSRELPGNTHAEQCALEKYFARTGEKDVPEGTVIYTTMEPCSERLSGNLPCVDRILGTSIKTVFVGVLEPDTFIKNNTGLRKLQDKNVEYIQIPGYEDECLEAAFKGHPGH